MFAKAALLVASALMVLALCGCSNVAGQARKADEAGSLKSAVSLYQQLLKADPNSAVAIKGLAADLYIMGRFDEALPMEQKAIALDPKDAQTRVELGFNYLNHQHQPSKAVEVLTQASILEPSAKYLTFLAQAQKAAGDSPAAEATLRKALAEDSSYGHAYTVLLSLLEAEGRASEAAQLREEAKNAGVTVQVG
jgi:predicted Zn-dependent protease